MDWRVVAWIAFGIYIALTTVLAVLGMRKTKSLASFAIGNGDMGPLLVGITLASSVASTATFVINPGFVFANGLSALLHFGVSAAGGVIISLIVLSKGFRAHGTRTTALTLPHWIGARYESEGLRTYFALLNLVLAVSFIVLIVVGCAYVMREILGLSYAASVLFITGFVFSYIMIGGSYAHAYTNALQGGLMVIVALVVFGAGLHHFAEGLGAFADRLAAQDPALIAPFHPTNPLFGSAWAVFFTPFVVGLGLVCQPHILTKGLYLRSDRDVNRYLLYSTLIGVAFSLVLVVGLYARVEHPELASLPQDAIIARYLALSFPPLAGILISVTMLAAGMSTLDGVLLSASTIAGNDLVLGVLGRRFLGGKSLEERQRLGLAASRYILVLMGVIAVALALHPPKLAGIFAQVGLYALIAASLAPISLGIFLRELDRRDVFAGAVLGPLVHFTYYLVSTYGLETPINPAVSAAAGTAVCFAVILGATAVRRLAKPETAEAQVETRESA